MFHESAWYARLIHGGRHKQSVNKDFRVRPNGHVVWTSLRPVLSEGKSYRHSEVEQSGLQ